MSDKRSVLIVGATGFLGGKVAREAVAQGYRVRALVSKGTDAAALNSMGVDLAEGDMLHGASLENAMSGCDAVITTAAGYTGRRNRDFTSATDTQGHRNLAVAAKRAGINRYVLCSVLTCDRARSVPHFWHKKLAEDALEQAGVPFIALRPGAFLDQGPGDFWHSGLLKGKLAFLANPSVKATFVHPDDVARYLVQALDVKTDKRALTIDIGTDRPISVNEIASVMSRLLDRNIKARVPPWPLVSVALWLAGFFRPQLRDMRQMMAYFQGGSYIADTTLQQRLFGALPLVDAGIEQYLVDRALLPRQARPPVSTDRFSVAGYEDR